MGNQEPLVNKHKTDVKVFQGLHRPISLKLKVTHEKDKKLDCPYQFHHSIIIYNLYCTVVRKTERQIQAKVLAIEVTAIAVSQAFIQALNFNVMNSTTLWCITIADISIRRAI